MKYLTMSRSDVLLHITTNSCSCSNTICKNQNPKLLLGFIIRNAPGAWDGGGGDEWKRAEGSLKGDVNILYLEKCVGYQVYAFVRAHLTAYLRPEDFILWKFNSVKN